MLTHAPPPIIDTDGPIETRLLAIFRALALMRVLLAGVFLLLPDGAVSGIGLTGARWLTLTESLLLLLFLSIPPLRRRLNRAYLPIAIGWATIMPLITQHLTLYWTLDTVNSLITGAAQPALLDSTAVLGVINQTILVLIVPLIVVAWAWSRAALAVYCVAILALDLAVTALFFTTHPTVFLLAFALIIFRTLLCAVIGILINLIAGVQRQQQRRLIAANDQLREYAAVREQLAATRERMRLARELHDTLAHTLTAATVQLEAVGLIWTQQPERAQALVGRSAAMMRDGLAETRRALAALRAGSLEGEHLADAVRRLAESLMTRYPIAITVSAPDPFTAIAASSVEHGLYRIAQEALFNAARHAGAQIITVTLESAPGRASVTVRDDGAGFDAESAAAHDGHYGLRGMRERADLIGADLTIISRIGAGTTVRACWTGEQEANHAHTDLR